jgi:hypothetical protein
LNFLDNVFSTEVFRRESYRDARLIAFFGGVRLERIPTSNLRGRERDEACRSELAGGEIGLSSIKPRSAM